MKNIFIAGVSSGIGRGMAEEHIHRGDTVYAIGRNEPKSLISHPRFIFMSLDLFDADMVRDALREFVIGRQFDRAILNAAMYPEMRDMPNTTLDALRYIMNVNLWSHKHTIDALLAHTQTEQIVALGANPALFGRKGMGTFAISKAALAAMIEVYAEEYPGVHFSTIAPKLTQTPTLSAFLKANDPIRYPMIQKIRDSLILPLSQAIPELIDGFEKAKRLPSGSSIDIKRLGLSDL